MARKRSEEIKNKAVTAEKLLRKFSWQVKKKAVPKPKRTGVQSHRLGFSWVKMLESFSIWVVSGGGETEILEWYFLLVAR